MRHLLPVVVAACLVPLLACSSSKSPSSTPPACVDVGCSASAPCCAGTCDVASGTCSCFAADASCTAGNQCCSGSCNASSKCDPVCVTTGCSDTLPCCSGTCQAGTCVGACKAASAACTETTECCNGLSCVIPSGSTIGQCQVEHTCSPLGTDCTQASECCSQNCAGTCQAVIAGGFTCKTDGESCAVATDCCSQNCQGGSCLAAASCAANGDLCSGDADCCGHHCTLAAGLSVGRCQDPSGGCIQDGNPCAYTGGKCCSAICADTGSGVATCVPATGCRVAGDWCTAGNDYECCGGSTAGVTCAQNLGNRCDNGQACNPPGAICGAPVLPGGGSVPAPQDCCDGKKAVCKLDISGIPRCFGGGSTQCPKGYDATTPGCCIPAGQACEFRDQCCNYAPCILASPTDTAKTCAAVSTCLPEYAGCNPSADACCQGTSCSQVESGFMCLPPPTQGCHAKGAGCTSGADCCSGVCTGSPSTCQDCLAQGASCGSGTPCCSGVCSGATPTCQPPLQCQPSGGVCAGPQDCCSGLTCSIPSGGTLGTCQAGATCVDTGQQCTVGGMDCCTGLSCDEGAYVPCSGAATCTCVLRLPPL